MLTAAACSTGKQARPDAPAIVLLHGFPASSFMFRDLIPLLADRYHVIAPDHLGFGLSDAPPAGEFGYTFDALAGLTAGLLRPGRRHPLCHVRARLRRPGGLAARPDDPDAVTAIITQNGNGYEAGFVDDFWKPVREFWRDRNPQTEAAVRQALTLDAIRWQYLQGVPDESLVSPDTWEHDFAQVSRPGNDLVQLDLFADYATNLPLYPKLHAWLRGQPGAAAGRLGPQRPDLRPRRRPRLRRRLARRARSACSTAATSCSKATSTPPRATSVASWEEYSHDWITEGPGGAD